MQLWIELSMPAVWTVWYVLLTCACGDVWIYDMIHGFRGIFFFACTMLCFVWRTGPANGGLDMSFGGWVVLAIVFFAPGINFAKHCTTIGGCMSGSAEQSANNERAVRR
jgi:hypothetical protein